MKVEDLPLIVLRLVRDEPFDLCTFASMFANLASISIEIVEVLYSNHIECENECKSSEIFTSVTRRSSEFALAGSCVVRYVSTS